MLNDLYKGQNNKKSIILNKKRTIVKQICNYLVLNGLIKNRNAISKQKDLIRLFFKEIEHDIPPTWEETWTYLLSLYESDNFDILKAHLSRPDIPSSTWKSLRKKVFDKWGKFCLKCGSNEYVAVDHIKPYSLYPELIIEFNNLQPLCRSCNSKKSNKIIVDYRPK
jgi:hypothetical protein